MAVFVTTSVHAVYLVIVALLQNVTFCTGACKDCVITYLPNFDDVRILDYNLWNRKGPNIGVCFMLCYYDSLCVSYHYNDNVQSCYGYSSSFVVSSKVITVPDPGTTLYVTCKGLNHFGAACSASTDCHDVDNDCLGGFCQCKVNYKYSTVTWDCFQYYFGCYEDSYTDRLLVSVSTTPSNLTIDTCISDCRSNGYTLAGLQYATYCFCDSTMSPGHLKLPDADCNLPCPGDAQQKCGAAWKIAAYDTRQ